MERGGPLDPQDGDWAVRFARRVVESVVQDGGERPDVDGAAPILLEDRGAFVTLQKGGSLRGCIGRPKPDQLGVTAIEEAATGAALDDPRFPPVRPEELDAITVEVSVLTPPEPIDGDPEHIPEQITIGRDGLIVENGARSGLLLPQVPVDREWTAEEFLGQTCRKAGLPINAWREDSTELKRFSAQVFAEVEPRGAVEPVALYAAEKL